MKIQIDMDKYANVYPFLQGKDIRIQIDRRDAMETGGYYEAYCYSIDGEVCNIPLYVESDLQFDDQLEEFVRGLDDHFRVLDEQKIIGSMEVANVVYFGPKIKNMIFLHSGVPKRDGDLITVSHSYLVEFENGERQCLVQQSMFEVNQEITELRIENKVSKQ